MVSVEGVILLMLVVFMLAIVWGMSM